MTPVVLAATDFSSHARHAVDRAARIVRESRSTLRLLHVLPGPALVQLREWLGAGSTVAESLRGEARTRLEELARQTHEARGVTVETALLEGSVLEAALESTEQPDVRLVVLGARGAGFVRRLTFGTTAERLMRRCSRPLLVVRQTPHESYQRVLVAVDFSEGSLATLAAARWVAPHAQLVLASVFEVPFESQLRFAGVDDQTIVRYREQARSQALQRLHALAAGAGLAPGQWQPSVVEGDAAFRLLELEQEYDCDLVALGKHGTGMAVDMLLGSVSQRVIADGSGDVLIATRP